MRKIRILIEKNTPCVNPHWYFFPTVITVMKTFISQQVFHGGCFLRF